MTASDADKGGVGGVGAACRRRADRNHLGGPRAGEKRQADGQGLRRFDAAVPAVDRVPVDLAGEGIVGVTAKARGRQVGGDAAELVARQAPGKVQRFPVWL